MGKVEATGDGLVSVELQAFQVSNEEGGINGFDSRHIPPMWTETTLPEYAADVKDSATVSKSYWISLARCSSMILSMGRTKVSVQAPQKQPKIAIHK